MLTTSRAVVKKAVVGPEGGEVAGDQSAREDLLSTRGTEAANDSGSKGAETSKQSCFSCLSVCTGWEYFIFGGDYSILGVEEKYGGTTA